jgi:hypothetical protein
VNKVIGWDLEWSGEFFEVLEYVMMGMGSLSRSRSEMHDVSVSSGGGIGPRSVLGCQFFLISSR